MLHACSKTRDSVALASRPRLDFEYALLPSAVSHPYTWEHVFVLVFYGYGGVERRTERDESKIDRKGRSGKVGRGEGGLVMSGERADNGALLDYTDLFGPAGRCKSLLKTSNCRLCSLRVCVTRSGPPVTNVPLRRSFVVQRDFVWSAKSQGYR